MFDDAAIELAERFIECCLETSDAFEELMTYNTKEGPLFADIGAVSRRFLSVANDERATFADVLAIGKRIDNGLINDLKAIEYCRGAPLEVLTQARSSWRRFKKLIDAIK